MQVPPWSSGTLFSRQRWVRQSRSTDANTTACKTAKPASSQRIRRARRPYVRFFDSIMFRAGARSPLSDNLLLGGYGAAWCSPLDPLQHVESRYACAARRSRAGHPLRDDVPIPGVGRRPEISPTDIQGWSNPCVQGRAAARPGGPPGSRDSIRGRADETPRMETVWNCALPID